MKRKVDHPEPDAGQLLFTYRRTVVERLASGELRDVSREAKAAGFPWPLAVTRRLWEEVEAIPSAHRHTESARARWQHLFLLAAPAAVQMQREGRQAGEINVVLRTTNAPDRSREHMKTLALRAEDRGGEPDQAGFTLGYKGE